MNNKIRLGMFAGLLLFLTPQTGYSDVPNSLSFLSSHEGKNLTSSLLHHEKFEKDNDSDTFSPQAKLEKNNDNDSRATNSLAELSNFDEDNSCRSASCGKIEKAMISKTHCIAHEKICSTCHKFHREKVHHPHGCQSGCGPTPPPPPPAVPEPATWIILASCLSAVVYWGKKMKVVKRPM